MVPYRIALRANLHNPVRIWTRPVRKQLRFNLVTRGPDASCREPSSTEVSVFQVVRVDFTVLSSQRDADYTC